MYRRVLYALRVWPKSENAATPPLHHKGFVKKWQQRFPVDDGANTYAQHMHEEMTCVTTHAQRRHTHERRQGAGRPRARVCDVIDVCLRDGPRWRRAQVSCRPSLESVKFGALEPTTMRACSVEMHLSFSRSSATVRRWNISGTCKGGEGTRSALYYHRLAPALGSRQLVASRVTTRGVRLLAEGSLRLGVLLAHVAHQPVPATRESCEEEA